MEDYAIKLASLFKERDNKENIGITTGKVLSVTPLKIGILNNEIILTGTKLIVSDTFANKTIVVGDSVIVIASDNNQTFFVIDKVG